MRSLMFAFGACLVAVNLAGCSGTGSCSSGKGLLCGGILNSGTSGCTGCGTAACSSGCCDTGRSCGCGTCGNQLGSGTVEVAPCHSGECQSGESSRVVQLTGRMSQRLPGRGNDCGCGGPAVVESDCGCAASSARSVPLAPVVAPVAPVAPVVPAAPVTPVAPATITAPATISMLAPPPTLGCGCVASAAAEVPEGDTEDCGCTTSTSTEKSDVKLASHNDRGGLLGKMGLIKTHQPRGCGVRGCGGPAGLCTNCLCRLRPGAGGLRAGAGGLRAGAGGGLSAGKVPHRNPSIHSGGSSAGPAGQIPTYAYPYYTTRAPRDFLDPKPPTIGY